MTTYGQFCPVAQALEIIAERWTLLVVRELLCGSHRLNDLLRGVPKMSRTMLSQRLKTLEDAGLVHRRAEGAGSEYHLTQAGEALRAVVVSVGEWGHRWLDGTLPETQLDPSLLMWDIHRRIDHDAITLPRVVVRFEFSDLEQAKQRYWLKLEDGDAEVCFKHPGFAEDLVVVTDVRTLTEVWMGRRALADAIHTGVVRMDGTAAVRRDFPAWLKLSTFALGAKP